MQLRHLRYYLALAREGHFGRAAEACNITQSTLSAAIRQLENEIGAPLIERDKRFKGLTAEGEVLRNWANRVVAERDELDQTIGLLRDNLSGSLTIGVIPTALPVVGLLTTPLSRAYPAITLRISSLTSNQIQQQLDDFVLDVGVTYLDNEPLHGVETHRLYSERYILLTPADGPFRGRKTVSWQEAAETPLCLLTPDMQNRRILDAIFADVGVVPNAHVETNSLLTLCSHIRTGAWSSVLPHNFQWLFGKPEGMLALPLTKPERAHQIGLVIRGREPIAPLVDIFVKTVLAAGIEAQIAP